MRRSHVIATTIFFLAVALVCVYALSRKEPKHLNVVLISIDSLRADHMGTYGYKRDITPNIDAFAKNAVLFENYFSTSFITPISEGSVHTGQYPFTSGLITFESRYKPGTRTLASVLKANGWKTAAFGSSQEFFRIQEIRRAFSDGFDVYNISTGDPESAWFGRNQHSTAEAIDWAKKNAEEGQPFFLWFTLGSVHWPYGQDEPSHFGDSSYAGFMKPKKYATANQPEEMFNNLYGLYYKGKLYNERGGIQKQDASRDLTYVRNRYDDGILMTDRELKSLFEFLDQPDIRENTIVILQSEHGEDLGEHGYIAHYDVLDTQVHTPLIMRIPGVSERRVQDLISGVDVFPTVLDFLNISPGRVDGISYSDFLSSSTSAPRDAVYLSRTPLWERIISRSIPWLQDFVKKDDSLHFHDFAIRTTDWKLIHRVSAPVLEQYSWYGKLSGLPVEVPEYELYHVAVDPLEEHDVYSSEEGIALPLIQKLGVWERSMNAIPLQKTNGEKVQPYF